MSADPNNKIIEITLFMLYVIEDPMQFWAFEKDSWLWHAFLRKQAIDTRSHSFEFVKFNQIEPIKKLVESGNFAIFYM